MNGYDSMPIPLRGGDFHRIAERGIDDPLNSYPHTMAWFRDHLYVGTTRANMALLKVHNPAPLRCWPTNGPDDVYDLDLRAQIWRYAPGPGIWQRVFVSPRVVGTGGREVPREIGYRAMTVYKRPSTRLSGLYVGTWSPARAERGPILMHSTDGVTFTTLAAPSDDASLNSYRTLTPAGGRLFTSPTGRVGGRHSVSASAHVLVTDDPVVRGWQAASEVGFGQSSNVTNFEMAEFGGWLYVGTVNPTLGFEVWKMPLDAQPPYRWVRVVSAGAFRGPRNEAVVSMCAFNGALYIGTGILNGGYDRTYDVGPAAAELIRIHPDDTWDLVVGDTRSTPAGVKVPLSGFPAGFGEFCNGYIWRMAVHDGCLYAGTFNWTIFLRYLDRRRWPAIAGQLASRDLETIIDERGGFELWRTTDGERWSAVTRRGFGNPYNYGARTLVSTPEGLFVGAANPFGPEVAVETKSGWEYVPNRRGGLEVFLGRAG
jgi:hypothetical protein